jgi:hypothetical protein
MWSPQRAKSTKIVARKGIKEPKPLRPSHGLARICAVKKQEKAGISMVRKSRRRLRNGHLLPFGARGERQENVVRPQAASSSQL